MSDFTPNDLITLKKNVKVKNIFICGLGPNEYIRISDFTIASKYVMHYLILIKGPVM